MYEFRDQVECQKYCLERHSPRSSYHIVEPAGKTHLLGFFFRIVDLECGIRANQNRTLGQKWYDSSVMISEVDWSSFGGKHWKTKNSTWRFLTWPLAIDEKDSESLMQARPGDQPGYLKETIESFIGHSSMGLLCPPAKQICKVQTWCSDQNLNEKVSYKFYICSDVRHTHTETHSLPQENGTIQVRTQDLKVKHKKG